jgi:subtilisin family serine protease
VTRLALAASLAALAGLAPGTAVAKPGKISIGIEPGASVAEVSAAVAAATGGEVSTELAPIGALVVSVPDVETATEAADDLAGVEYAERVTRTRRLYFRPNDALYDLQWYLPYVRAFDFWTEQPPFPPVLVAVVDSGIDGTHPEFQGRIEAARSFVSSPATVDRFGHGTMVAGEIAAALNNAEGIAGAGFPVKLLIAKVAGVDGSISLEAEARAIRWAVDRGARVINLSLGGPRNPRDPARDTYSELERRAIDYATRRGVVVVAAAGNCDYLCPYPFASYPAALPHVLGVSALTREGTTPVFSNRDPVYNDLAAPGKGVVSTLPLGLSDPFCAHPGYSDCADTPEYRRGEGTSFASPLVAAAAGVVRSARTELSPDQVTAVLERGASDLSERGHDVRTGYGRLDVVNAMSLLGGPFPPADRYETNDDAGSRAFHLRGARRAIRATLHRYDDFMDVYRIRLRARQRVVVTLNGPAGSNTNLVLWQPGTRRVAESRDRKRARRAAQSIRLGARERIVYRARKAGWYYVEARLWSGRSGQYQLRVRKFS